MKREYLKDELGLADDVIEKIMIANGKDIENAKSSVAAKDSEIEGLKDQLSQRDADMEKLKTDLTAAQADAGKLPGLSQSLADLQTKYEQEKANLENKLNQQSYEFAIREKVGELEFTSKAAKEAFVNTAISKQFRIENGNLLGYSEFLDKYKADDPGAFAVAKPNPENRFVAPAGVAKPGSSPKGLFDFNFAGVRPHDDTK